LTLRLPDEVIRLARITAAERETSVSALVEGLLLRDAEIEARQQERWRRQLERMRTGEGLTGPFLGREESHGR
jgi:hypothetical protein